jgi:hypothetical protein
MLLRHATPIRNLASINRLGLLCSKSKGKLKAVWFHSPARTSWAVLHVVKRHGGRVQDVVVIEADVPRSWLRRHRKGVRYCLSDVPPSRFRRLITFAELAGRSADECRLVAC